MSAPKPPSVALDPPAVQELAEELELIRAVVNTVALAVSAQCSENDPDFEMTLTRFASDPLTQVIDRLRGRDDKGGDL
jgi:hypothetical protein